MERAKDTLANKRLLSTSYIKAVAMMMILINHTAIYSKEAEQVPIIANRYFFWFWIYQGVSAFIIVSGIHWTKSLQRLDNSSGLWRWYDKKIFNKKLSRFLLPYIVSQVVFVIFFVSTRKFYDVKMYLNWILTGGTGPGGYYTVCMLQILCIFPLLYYLVKKNPVIGSLIIFGMNFVWELLATTQIIPMSMNRLSCIRLLTGLLIGMLFFMYWEKLRGGVIPGILFVSGAIFLIKCSHLGYKPAFISLFANSSFAAVPYTAGIVYFTMSHEEDLQRLSEKNPVCKLLSKALCFIGDATYHILLVNQLYFESMYILIGGRWGLAKDSLKDLSICIIGGCLFYAADCACRDFMRKRKKLVSSTEG